MRLGKSIGFTSLRTSNARWPKPLAKEKQGRALHPQSLNFLSVFMWELARTKCSNTGPEWYREQRQTSPLYWPPFKYRIKILYFLKHYMSWHQFVSSISSITIRPPNVSANYSSAVHIFPCFESHHDWSITFFFII